MSPKLRRLFLSVIILVFVISLVAVFKQLIDYRKGADAYKDAQETVGIGPLKSSRTESSGTETDAETKTEPEIEEPVENDEPEQSRDEQDPAENVPGTPPEEEPAPREPNEHEEVLLVPREIDCNRVTFKYGVPADFRKKLLILHEYGLADKYKRSSFLLRRTRGCRTQRGNDKPRQGRSRP